MLKSYLVVALRGLRRQRGYAALNVLGLAVGLACCGLILLYVEHERSYDRFHADAARIYRVAEDRPTAGGVSARADAPAPLAALLRADVPAVEEAVRLYHAPGLVAADAGPAAGRAPVRFQEERLFYADSAFFGLFSFPLLRGDPATALDAPRSVVLTRTTAARYFGAAEPLGQTLTLRTADGAHAFTVTGLAEDAPANSHLAFDLLVSFATLEETMPWYDNWWHPPMHTYVRLAPARDPDAAAAGLAAALPGLVARRAGDGAPASRYHLQRLTDLHLRSHREGELAPNGHAAYVTLFTVAALVVLLIACINFMNLATARAASRAREVGVRKAVGARRGQLVRQFLVEAVLLTALAAVLAVGLAAAALPTFNAVAGTRLALDLLGRPGALAGLVGLVLGVGVLAGSYPAAYLSGFRPVRVLKGVASDGRSAAARLRRGLTVVQFALSVALLVGALTIHRQLGYVRDEHLGFDKAHVVAVPLRDRADTEDHAALKAAWARIPGVRHVAAASGTPGMEAGLHDFLVTAEGARADSLEMRTLTVDPDFAETLGLQFVAGRDFDAARPSDATAAFVINESAARRLGWADPLGHRLTVHYWLDDEVPKTGEVIGVVRDFQYHSLRQPVEPVVLHVLPGTYYNDYLAARLAPGDVAGTLAAMERAWAAFNPDRPFEYTFLDEQVAALYRAEARLGAITGAFTLLAVFVACLGLFGLAAFVAEQRTKEVGIRKALGASAAGIVALLAADFLKPVAVAVLVGAPLAYVVLDRWLEGFAYRIVLGPGLFAAAGALALLVALATVSAQALRAASADPVKALRYE
jgi:putative ABC transport system permease protein